MEIRPGYIRFTKTVVFEVPPEFIASRREDDERLSDVAIARIWEFQQSRYGSLDCEVEWQVEKCAPSVSVLMVEEERS